MNRHEKSRAHGILCGSVLLCVLAAPPLAGDALAESEEASQRHHRLEQIVVTGTRTSHTIGEAPVETLVIDREDMAKTNAQNAIDVLNNIPGVSASVHDDVFGTYTWRAKMRGLSFNDGYALILIDGQRVMGPGQSGGMGEYGIGLNQIPVAMIERIEVVKGPGSALYGSDAMAGVVNIITRRVPEESVAGAGVAYGWYTVRERIRDGVVERPAEESRNQSQAYAYFGDRPWERIGYLLQYGQESAQDTGPSRIDSARHSCMGKVEADLSERVRLSAKGELSDYEKEDNRKEKSHRLSAGVEWQPGDDHLLSLKGYIYNWDFDHGFVDTSHGHKYGDIGYHQVEGQYTWQADESHTLTAGAELQQQGIDFVIDNQDGSRIGVDKGIDTRSLYLQDEVVLLDRRVTLVPGIRYDNHATFGEEVNPKLSAMYRLAEATTLRASVGRAFKSPTIRQLYYDAPYRHGNYYNQSNPELQPETAVGYAAGIEQWLLANSVMVSAGYFRNDVKELVIVEDTGTLYNGLPLRIYRNLEKARIEGVELLSRLWPGDALSLVLSYTYTDSENRENGKALPYTPEHQLALTPACELKAYGVGMSATVSYASRQYTDTDNSAQIDGHTVVDAKITKALGETAKLSFEADNLFDSDKGDEANFRTGRTFMVKLDLTF